MKPSRQDRTRVVVWGAMALLSGAVLVRAETSATQEKAVRFEELVVRDRVDADGVLVRRQTNTVVLLTPGGVAQYSQVGVPFLESNQKAKLERLVITKPDGRELDLRESAPTDVASVLPPNLPIHSDLRLLRAAVPSLEIGDRLTFETSVRVEPLTEDHVWQAMDFADEQFVSSQLYELDVPAGSRLLVHVNKERAFVFEEERHDGRWVRRWRLDAPASEASSATAAEEKEEREAQVVDILVTSFTSWDEFGRWWASLGPPKVDAAVKAKAEQLTAALESPLEKLRAIHRYVAQEIRYLTLPLGLGRYRAREPAEVVKSGLGDCKDKARLLASLAASVGIEVDSVLVSVGEKQELVEEAPSPLQFDHVVSRAHIGEEEIWMDSTSEMTPMGRLPQGERSLRAVVVEGRSAKASIVKTPEPAGWVPAIRAETTASIDASGHVRAKVRWTYDSDAELLRFGFRYGEDADRRKIVESMSSEWDDDAKLGKFTFSEPRDLETPFWIEYEVEKSISPTLWRKAWTYWAPTTRLWLNAPPGADDDAKRRASGETPLAKVEIGDRRREVVSARFEFPEGVKVEPPVPVAIRRDFADYRSDYRVEGRTLVVERELVTKIDEVPRQQFEELRAFRERMKQDRDQEFDVAAAPSIVPEGAESASDLYSACWEELDADRHVEAERLCRRATEVDPGHDMAWNGLGNALLHQQRGNEAEAAYRRQLEIDPNHEFAWGGLARVAWRRGDLEEAEKLLRKQVDNAPLEAYGHSNLGGLLLQRGKLDEAETSLKRALKLEPEDEWTVGQLFELQARRGRLDELVALAADHPDVPRELDQRLRVAQLALEKGRGPWAPFAAWLGRLRTEAERTLENFEGTRPDASAMVAVWSLGVAWEAQARVALEQGRSAEAVALLESAQGLGVSSANALAEARRALGSPAAAAPPTSRISSSGLITRQIPAAAGTQGEIWLLFGADGRLEKAVPVDAGGPKALAAHLVGNPLTITVPPGNRARIPLKLLAYCSASGECNLTLERANQTWGQLEKED